MANTPQARKRIRRNARRAEINGSRMSRIRTFVKKVEAAIEGGDKETAMTMASKRDGYSSLPVHPGPASVSRAGGLTIPWLPSNTACTFSMADAKL